MSTLVEFANLQMFTNADELTSDEEEQLFKEAVLMVLARATSIDARIHHVEVETVQRVLQKVTGEEISDIDIRIAANFALSEKESLERLLSGIGRRLETDHRISIMLGLSEVIDSDEHISHFETDYFDMVANAINATPSEIAGLLPKGYGRRPGTHRVLYLTR